MQSGRRSSDARTHPVSVGTMKYSRADSRTPRTDSVMMTRLNS